MVASAVNPSESMMIIFRLYLSATTPAHSEINICGVSAAIVDIVIQLPEEVLSVIYQMMLKPTTEEPNMERFWLMKMCIRDRRYASFPSRKKNTKKSKPKWLWVPMCP